VSNSPEKKAELDKDGISFDFNKAQLDKDGISLTEAPENQVLQEAEGAGKAGEKQSRGTPVWRRRKIVLSLVAGVVAVCVAAGVFMVRAPKEDQQYLPASYPEPSPAVLTSSDGDILLDPFTVLFDPDNPRQSGVLLAQVSLQITPGTGPNIISRLFDIRNLIYQRLTANAGIYSKNELAAMIRQDLEDLQVKNVVFVQYEKR
jgi:hypothetical protein